MRSPQLNAFCLDLISARAAADLRAPLLESILSQARDLPAPPTFDDSPSDKNDAKPQKNKSTPRSKEQGTKALPKWLRIGRSKSSLSTH